MQLPIWVGLFLECKNLKIVFGTENPQFAVARWGFCFGANPLLMPDCFLLCKLRYFFIILFILASNRQNRVKEKMTRGQIATFAICASGFFGCEAF